MSSVSNNFVLDLTIELPVPPEKVGQEMERLSRARQQLQQANKMITYLERAVRDSCTHAKTVEFEYMGITKCIICGEEWQR